MLLTPFDLPNAVAQMAVGNSCVLPSMGTSAAVGDLNSGWKEIIDELLAIRTFRDDWDGTSSPAPDVEIVDFALRLVGWLQKVGMQPCTRATATPAGTVILEWQENSLYVEFEITGRDHLESMIMDLESGKTTHGSWTDSVPSFLGLA